MCNNEGQHWVGKIRKTESSTSEDSVSSSETGDVDHDKNKDYVPSDTTSRSEGEESLKKKKTLYTRN